MSIISVKNISKSYKETQALDNVTFDVNENELFGLIGPDGAGKTTLFRILTTLLRPSSGSAIVDGMDTVKDFKAIRNILGYMPGRFSLYQDLSVEENLNFFATVFGTTIEENYDLVKDIYSQIEPFKTRQAGKLSGGMKQKLALSCALIHKPKILILDEPTTGVDAVSRKEFWNMLKNLQKKEITIVVSTPYMDEASLCDRVALIQQGKVMSIDTPETITSKFNKEILAIRSSNMYNLIMDLRAYKDTHSVFIFGQYVHFTSKEDRPSKENVIKYLEEKGHTQIEIMISQPTVEDCFMELMKKEEEI